MFILLIQSVISETNTTTEEAINKLTEDAKIVLYSIFGTTGGSIIVGIILKCFGCCSCGCGCCSCSGCGCGSKADDGEDKIFHV